MKRRLISPSDVFFCAFFGVGFWLVVLRKNPPLSSKLGRASCLPCVRGGGCRKADGGVVELSASIRNNPSVTRKLVTAPLTQGSQALAATF